MVSPVDRNQRVIEEFRHNGGVVGGPFAGKPILLLHTVGAKTGLPRVNPLMFAQDGDRLVVVASKGGAPTNPGWYYNVLAHPQLTVEVGSEKFLVKATVAEEPERSRLYKKMIEVMAAFADYQQKTRRIIPAIVLTRVK